MYHMSETQVELMHRIADAQADAYDFIDEATRLKSYTLYQTHGKCVLR